MAAVALDQVCASAVETARAAAVAAAPPEQVGDWVSAVPEGERVVTHYFECLSPAYPHWRWAVTLARAPRARKATVSEVVLLPGDGAVLAPEWVPWQERVRPGDMGAGDLLPVAPDDPRLEPGLTGSDALEPDDETGGVAPLRPQQWERGIGRERVLSAQGRDDAATRWHTGDYGPDAAIAQAAPAECISCGFLVPVGGSLGNLFGLCANQLSPGDGRVVDLRYGCGGHSETPQVEGVAVPVSDTFARDDLVYEPVELPEAEQSEADLVIPS